MSLLSTKYKMHKFVNVSFYLVIFLFGFLVGIGAKKIKLDKLVSNVLFIDSASAYTMEIDYDNQYFTEINSNLDLNKKYNYLKSNFLDKQSYINNYVSYYYDNKIIVVYSTYTTRSNGKTSSYFNWSSSQFYLDYGSGSLQDVRVFELSLDNTYAEFSGLVDNIIGYASTNTSYLIHYTGSFSGFKKIIGNVFSPLYTSSYSKTSSIYTYNTTMPWIIDIKNVDLINSYSPSGKTTDLLIVNGTTYSYNSSFPTYWDSIDYTPIVYDENLFDNDPNFKQVCVNNYDTFSITSNQIQDYDSNNNPLYHSLDFIWFKNGMKGISTFGYDSEEHDHVYLFEESEDTFSGWWYWLDTAEEIDEYWNRDNPGIQLRAKGYTDKYKYYNWTLYPFEMTFTNSYHRYQVFWFKDPHIDYPENTDNHGGGGIRIGSTDDNLKYCFYIKNEYDVNILTKNQNGDFDSTITVLGGIEKNDTTYRNELSKNSNSFFSNINNFISNIRPTIIFINSNILNLYNSMPFIVRSFILAFLTLIIIRILIGMVMK